MPPTHVLPRSHLPGHARVGTTPRSFLKAILHLAGCASLTGVNARARRAMAGGNALGMGLPESAAQWHPGYCEQTNLRIVRFVALAGMLVPVRAAM
jgi:hypothetical protein